MKVHWTPEAAKFTGVLCTDGSAYNPANQDIRVAGWSVVQLDGLEIARAACALLPLEAMPDQSVPAAELFAVLFALEHSEGQIQIWTDCAAVIAGVEKGVPHMAEGEGAMAHLWKRIAEVYCGARVTFHKVKAHQKRPSEDVPWQARVAWYGNDHADRLAKGIVAGLNCEVKLSRHRYLRELATLAGVQGEAMAERKIIDTPDWLNEWIKPDRFIGALPRRKSPKWEPPVWLETLRREALERVGEWRDEIACSARGGGASKPAGLASMKLLRWSVVHKVGAGHSLQLYILIGAGAEVQLLACCDCGAYLQQRLGSLQLECAQVQGKGAAQQRLRLERGFYPLTGAFRGVQVQWIRAVAMDELLEM
eukprot:6462778-Amphidinium_carterae.1